MSTSARARCILAALAAAAFAPPAHSATTIQFTSLAAAYPAVDARGVGAAAAPATSGGAAAPQPVATLPEVEVWAMLLAGFGLVALTARRRRLEVVAN